MLLLSPAVAEAKGDTEAKNDSVPFFNGFAVSVDLVGPVQMLISDYGQYEAALRINLKDRYFPVVEMGIGKADHTNDATDISYKTSAPYFKVGVDFNLLKNKHDIYRLFAGIRYAFTSFQANKFSPSYSSSKLFLNPIPPFATSMSVL